MLSEECCWAHGEQVQQLPRGTRFALFQWDVFKLQELQFWSCFSLPQSVSVLPYMPQCPLMLNISLEIYLDRGGSIGFQFCIHGNTYFTYQIILNKGKLNTWCEKTWGFREREEGRKQALPLDANLSYRILNAMHLRNLTYAKRFQFCLNKSIHISFYWNPSILELGWTVIELGSQQHKMTWFSSPSSSGVYLHNHRVSKMHKTSLTWSNFTIIMIHVFKITVPTSTARQQKK